MMREQYPDSEHTAENRALKARICELEHALAEHEVCERASGDFAYRFTLHPSDIPLGYQSLNRDGVILEVNEVWLSTLGYTRDEVIGKRFDGFLTPEAGEKFRECYPNVCDYGEIHGILLNMVKKDGSIVIAYFDAKCVFSTDDDSFKFTHCIWKDITKELKAEQKLRISEEKYRFFLHNFQGIAYQAEIDTFRLLMFEGQVEEITGYTIDDFMTGVIRWDQLIHHDDLDILHTESRRLMKEPQYVARSMYRIRRRTGELRWVHDIAQRVEEPDHDYSFIQGSVYDVTPRKLAEEALKESQSLASILLDTSDESTILVKTDGTIVAINEIGARRLGITADDIGQNIYDLVPGDDLEQRRNEAARFLATKQPYSFEDEWDDVFYQTTVTPILDRAGEIHLAAVYSRDITEHKLNEASLREKNRQISEQQTFLEGIYNGVDTPMFVVGVGEDGTFTYIDNNACHLRSIGIPKEAFAGKTPDDLVPPFPQDVIDRVKERYRECIAAGTAIQYEEKLYIKGQELWSLTRLTPLRDSDGKVCRIIGFSIDITKEKQAEQAYRESEDRYRRLLNASPISIVAIQDGNYVYANPNAVEKLGYGSQEEVIGVSLLETIVPNDQQVVLDRFSRLENESVLEPVEVEIVRPDGGYRIMESYPVAMQLNDSSAVLVLAVDITERRKLEGQLVQSQKMESIGRLAGGIAHDFNNLLTVITGNCELALMSLPRGSEVHDELTEISATADRAARLTRQLLAFSRKQIIEPRIISINDVLMQLDRMLRRLIGEDIELVVLPAEHLMPVKADPGQIEQVLINLVVNAREAMIEGGTITIETANLTEADMPPHHSLKSTTNDYVMLSITDTGIGMDSVVLSKIFEPFFTTKIKSKGTGLGLSTCYGIIKQSHGDIVVRSEPGTGSTFTVYLPVTGERQHTFRQLSEELLPKGTEHILVVEDEDSVRRMVVRMLQESGYQVINATNGEEALKVLAGHEGIIHLVVTDVVMPRMGGRELAEHLKTSRPEIKILFMSGYTDERIDRHGILEEGVAFIQKPFTPRLLLMKVGEVLGHS